MKVKPKNLRITENAMSLAEIWLVDTVDFCKFDTLFFKSSRSFFIMRSERLAVSAPRSVKLNEQEITLSSPGSVVRSR